MSRHRHVSQRPVGPDLSPPSWPWLWIAPQADTCTSTHRPMLHSALRHTSQQSHHADVVCLRRKPPSCWLCCTPTQRLARLPRLSAITHSSAACIEASNVPGVSPAVHAFGGSSGRRVAAIGDAGVAALICLASPDIKPAFQLSCTTLVSDLLHSLLHVWREVCTSADSTWTVWQWAVAR